MYAIEPIIRIYHRRRLCSMNGSRPLGVVACTAQLLVSVFLFVTYILYFREHNLMGYHIDSLSAQLIEKRRERIAGENRQLGRIHEMVRLTQRLVDSYGDIL